MKIKCQAIFDDKESYGLYKNGNLPSFTVEIPDYNDEEHKDEYGDMEQYIEEVAGDKIEEETGKTIKGMTWKVLEGFNNKIEELKSLLS